MILVAARVRGTFSRMPLFLPRPVSRAISSSRCHPSIERWFQRSAGGDFFFSRLASFLFQFRCWNAGGYRPIGGQAWLLALLPHGTRQDRGYLRRVIR